MSLAEPLRFACTPPATAEEEAAACAFLDGFVREWTDALRDADCELLKPAKPGGRWSLSLRCGRHTRIFHRPTALDLVECLMLEAGANA